MIENKITKNHRFLYDTMHSNRYTVISSAIKLKVYLSVVIDNWSEPLSFYYFFKSLE